MIITNVFVATQIIKVTVYGYHLYPCAEKGNKNMKAFKGFNKDLTCRNFQYEEGKTYKTKEATICKTGFHANEYYEQDSWTLNGAKMVRVDGKKIKKNTWYTMIDGKVIECMV